MKRNIGADIFRILCCIGVLIYHIVDDVCFSSGQSVDRLVYFSASYCVPGFFMLSGYLVMGNGDGKNFDYYEYKAIAVMKKLFGWITFWTSVHFLLSGELYDIWTQFTAGLSSSGILPLAWFLFTYALIVGVVAFPMYKVVKKCPHLMGMVVAIMLVLLAMGVGRTVIFCRDQALWLHLYVTYFILGMIISSITEKHLINKKLRICMEIFSLTFSSLMYFLSVNNADSFSLPETYYGKWFYSIWLISIFMICLEIHIANERIKKIIARISSDTMTVYLAHLPILLYITEKRPLKSLSEALLMVIVIFIVTEMLAEVFRRLPLLRKLV